ncbi:MAG: SufS family cysteine desulfurase [bacterium]|nr:SufS family cysteine desulfurase [bacterium]
MIPKIRNQFPIFQKRGLKPLAYLDNAATTQKPATVIEAMDKFYRSQNAPVHRGVYALAEGATAAYEKVRDQVKEFVNAKHREEIIFTSGATESINVVVAGLSEAFLKRGDRILLSDMEHHAMIVPWQAAARLQVSTIDRSTARKKLKLDFVPLNSEGRIDIGAFKKLLAKHKPKFVGVTHVSNVLGTENPVREMISLAHKAGALVLVDAAQSIAHGAVDVQALGCDFLAFSGHKMYGPTGIGVLYGKKELLEKLPPHKFGGHMIAEVTRTKTTYAPLPEKFEGGTPPVAEVIGLGAAISFLQSIGLNNIAKYEGSLTAYALRALKNVPGLALLGPATTKARAPIFSFTIKGIHAHDIATLLDREGIAVRAGHHCAQILHESLSLDASVRASLCIYNTAEEVDRLVSALVTIQRKFQ